jgi:OOP family OmpA-OmpF porin
MKQYSFKKTLLNACIISVTASAMNAVVADEQQWPTKYTAIGIEGNYNVAAEGATEDRFDNLENYFEYGVSLHHRFNPKISVRLQYANAEADTTNTDSDVDIERIQLGIRRHADEEPSANWRPFAGLGYDYVEYDVEITNRQVDENAVYAEVGLQRLLGSRALVEVGTRVRAEFDELYVDGQPFVGLQYLMGREYPAQPEVAAPAPAPMDTDKDGVVDPMDQCPDTAIGLLVDEKGCPQLLTKTIQKSLYVEFDLNKTDVKRTSYSEIEEFATYLKQYINSELVLEGHTDSSGSDNYNMRLSEARAAAVKRVLVEQYGIDANRIDTVGMGETQPIADNSTVDGRAQNRRVEAVLRGSYTEAARK